MYLIGLSGNLIELIFSSFDSILHRSNIDIHGRSPPHDDLLSATGCRRILKISLTYHNHVEVTAWRHVLSFSNGSLLRLSIGRISTRPLTTDINDMFCSMLYIEKCRRLLLPSRRPPVECNRQPALPIAAKHPNNRFLVRCTPIHLSTNFHAVPVF